MTPKERAEAVTDRLQKYGVLNDHPLTRKLVAAEICLALAEAERDSGTRLAALFREARYGPSLPRP